jgi:small basic protein
MSNFVIYMIGVVLVACALAYAASLLGVSSTWIGVGLILIIGFGIMAAVARTRRREPSQTEQ